MTARNVLFIAICVILATLCGVIPALFTAEFGRGLWQATVSWLVPVALMLWVVSLMAESPWFNLGEKTTLRIDGPFEDEPAKEATGEDVNHGVVERFYAVLSKQEVRDE